MIRTNALIGCIALAIATFFIVLGLVHGSKFSISVGNREGGEINRLQKLLTGFAIANFGIWLLLENNIYLFTFAVIFFIDGIVSRKQTSNKDEEESNPDGSKMP